MRYIASVLIALVIFMIMFPSSGHASPSVSAQNAILIEKDTGRVLYEKQAHDPQLIASITKIMTALLAIESGKMNETVTVSQKAVYTEGSSIYLEEGEKIPLEDLVYGLMLRSGNDAAVAISEYVGGSVEGFAHLMNEKAKWIGMTNTSFDNPHGLDSEKHYSTAYDMAMLMRYAMENEKFQEITSANSYKSDNRTYSWKNKNKLLTMFYEYCTGGKTGFTKAAGRTLVSSASKDGMDLIAVTLDAPDDWRDHMKLYDWGFDNYHMETLSEKGEVQLSLQESSHGITGYIQEDTWFPLTEDEKSNLEQRNYIANQALQSGDEIIGKSIFYLNSELLVEIPIFGMDDPEEEEESMLSSLVSMLKKIIKLG